MQKVMTTFIIAIETREAVAPTGQRIFKEDIMEINTKYDMGQKVKDKVTGLTGIIDSIAQCMNGCIRYSVQPKINKEQKVPSSYWIDEQQLELVDKKPVVKTKQTKTGGPMTISRE